MDQKTCPDCKGELENGAFLDYTHGGILVGRYAKTETPTNKDVFNKFKVHESNYDDVRRIIAKRCTKCNRIFTYAQDIVLTPNLNALNNKFTWIVIAFMIVLFVVMTVGIIWGINASVGIK